MSFFMLTSKMIKLIYYIFEKQNGALIHQQPLTWSCTIAAQKIMDGCSLADKMVWRREVMILLPFVIAQQAYARRQPGYRDVQNSIHDKRIQGEWSHASRTSLVTPGYRHANHAVWFKYNEYSSVFSLYTV